MYADRRADVSKLSDMESLYRTIGSQFGRLDIVVANAGVGDNAPLGKITEEQFDKVIGTNLKGVLFTVQAALPMLKAGCVGNRHRLDCVSGSSSADELIWRNESRHS